MMKSKPAKVAISFITIILINILLLPFSGFGLENPHVGFLFVLGLAFGPYGALGAVLGNIVIDLVSGYGPVEILPSAIISFGVSYLAYKLWYSGFKTDKITKPRLDNIYHLLLFLSSLVICTLIYSSTHATLIGIFYTTAVDEYRFVSYFMNFINIGFIFGVLVIWLSKKFDFIEVPKASKTPANKKLYWLLIRLLLLMTVISSITLLISQNETILMVNLLIMQILLFAYLTRPIEHEVQPNAENTMTEKILNNFLILTLIIASFGVLVSILNYSYLESLPNINQYLVLMPTLIITDISLILFFIPCIIILRYIETKVIQPISSFSEIESFIVGENEKIEAEGLLNVYSKYVNENTEIGTLARSYTHLINSNNNYIENIRRIEGEQKRIEAELDIATKIQAENLPTEVIETDDFIVNGYSKPAKEVGGDFFDYYILDDNHLAVVIGDVSGKGVPAAILAMISQVMIKQLLTHNPDPAKVLYLLNNQLCENNSEAMFVTLWLGIYNKSTNKLIFSNAGHNPPLIKENGKFKFINIDSGIVIGIMEDFDYVTEEMTLTDELVLYTDGITDANNIDGEMYGEDGILNFLNGFESDYDPIDPLLNDIRGFTGDAEQFDDMTLLNLKIK